MEVLTIKASRWFCLLWMLAILNSVSQAQQVTLTPSGNNLFNSGYNGASAGIPGELDTHYTLVNFNNAPTYRALTLAANWYSKSSNSSWITISPKSYNGANATFYEYNLPLTGIPLGSQVSITANMAVDDSVVISANGSAPLFSNMNSSVIQNHYQTFYPATFSFIAGATNNLDFDIFNVNGPTGLNVALTGFYVTPTPVPTPSPIPTPVPTPSSIPSPDPVPRPRHRIAPTPLPTTSTSSSSGTGTTPVPVPVPTPGPAPVPVRLLVQFIPTGLNANQTQVLNRINAINLAGTGNACFEDLTYSLVGINSDAFGKALDELSPERLDILEAIAFNDATFTTQDLDEYLAHRRNALGELQSAPTDFDVSGLTINQPGIDPGLSSTYNRLLAWNPAPSGTGLPSQFGAVVPSSEPNHWNTFLRGSVILGQNLSSEALSHANYTTSSFQLGTDYQLSPHWLAGALFSYNHTDTALDEIGSSATIDSYSPGIYASFAQDGWYMNALAEYSRNNYTEQRNIEIGDFNKSPHGAFSGDEEVANLDGGYEFHTHDWTYGPSLGLQYVHLNFDSFNESGGCSSDLAIHGHYADSFRSRLGGHISHETRTDGMILTPFLDVSWQHEFLDDSHPITATFSEVDDTSFSVDTANPTRDSALIAAGLNIDFNKTATAFLNYQAQAGQSSYFGQSVVFGIKIAF